MRPIVQREIQVVPKTIILNRKIKSQNLQQWNKAQLSPKFSDPAGSLIRKRPNNPQISLLVNKHYNNKAFQYYQGHGALLEGR